MRSFTRTILAGAIALSALAGLGVAQDNPMVGGAAMFADKNIVENAVNSADHTTLVAAVQAAGLVETLSGEGPFTVFAPPTTRSPRCRKAPSTICSCRRTRSSSPRS